MPDQMIRNRKRINPKWFDGGNDDVGATGGSPSLGKPGTVWQRKYHDHIVRNGTGLAKIRQYIHDNPKEWETDDHFVSGEGKGITTSRCTGRRDRRESVIDARPNDSEPEEDKSEMV